MKKYLALALITGLTACGGNGTEDPVHDPTLDSNVPPPLALNYTIVAEYPHDTSAYTQGLEIHNGKFYEGTGDFENSSLRITDIKTGKVEKKHMMGNDKIFGEGITVLNGKLYQLTWQSNIVYVYDVHNIDKPINTFKWPYEGWGITNNGKDLFISDGSANLYTVDPTDFKVKTIVKAVTNRGPETLLNELEYIDGFVFANVYQSDYILKIDPATGFVKARLDLPGLKQKYFPDQLVPERTDVLNGIAYDSTTKKLYITGKRWPKMFEVQLN